MKKIENAAFDQERALYGEQNLILSNCKIDGPADGESALKECRGITAEGCYFNLRYPFWHDDGLLLKSCEMTEKCRASLWYTQNAEIKSCRLHGIKALRECKNVKVEECSVISPEFGWFCDGVTVENCSLEGEYAFLKSSNLTVKKLDFRGKYSFQYVKNAVIEGSVLTTKDAFWHAENVVVKNCVVKGEYLAWYCKGVTFIDCEIEGTQPFCYCKDLTLVNCRMNNADLCFEKSEVNATLLSPLVSIKNPYTGTIVLPECGEIILDDVNAKAEIIVQNK